MRARALRAFGAAAVAAACSGPPAPDGAVCRDVIHRLCLPLRCPAVTTLLGASDDCEDDLLTRTGCAAQDFAFPDPPGRERVLEARLTLIREGLNPEQHPDCADVQDMLELYPDVTQFLKEGPP